MKRLGNPACTMTSTISFASTLKFVEIRLVVCQAPLIAFFNNLLVFEMSSGEGNFVVYCIHDV